MTSLFVYINVHQCRVGSGNFDRFLHSVNTDDFDLACLVVREYSIIHFGPMYKKNVSRLFIWFDYNVGVTISRLFAHFLSYTHLVQFRPK